MFVVLQCCLEVPCGSPIPLQGQTMISAGAGQCGFCPAKAWKPPGTGFPPALKAACTQAALCSSIAFCSLMAKLNTHLAAIASSCTFCHHWEEVGSGVTIAVNHEVIGCCSTTFGLLFIRLYKLSCSASPQWYSALEPGSTQQPSTLAPSSFLMSVSKWVAKILPFSTSYLTGEMISFT